MFSAGSILPVPRGLAFASWSLRQRDFSSTKIGSALSIRGCCGLVVVRRSVRSHQRMGLKPQRAGGHERINSTGAPPGWSTVTPLLTAVASSLCSGWVSSQSVQPQADLFQLRPGKIGLQLAP
jgi:hypothetical protein